MHGHLCFTNGCMSQQGESGQVTANINTRHGGLHLLIHFDSPTFCLFQIQVFEPETFCHRTTADTHQQLLRYHTATSFRILIRDNSSSFRLRQADNFRTKQEFNASLCIFRTQQSRKFLIHSAENLIQHFDYRHLHAQAIEERSELHSYHSATDNGQRSGQFFIIQRVPVRPVIHRFHSGNRGNKGFRTGAKYQVLTFVSLLTAADCILIYDLCFSRYYRDIVRSQLRLHPQYQFTHHFALTDNNLG